MLHFHILDYLTNIDLVQLSDVNQFYQNLTRELVYEVEANSKIYKFFFHNLYIEKWHKVDQQIIIPKISIFNLVVRETKIECLQDNTKRLLLENAIFDENELITYLSNTKKISLVIKSEISDTLFHKIYNLDNIILFSFCQDRIYVELSE